MGFPGVEAPVYTEAQVERINALHTLLIESIDRGEWNDQPLNAALLRALHGAIFDGVVGHAGRFRERGALSEVLRFGTRYSAKREDVPRLVDELFRRLRVDVREVEGDGTERRDLAALTLALRVHARVIEIHPFEDGNGRASRLLLALLLVRLGWRRIPIEAPKDEYIRALDHLFDTDDAQPLVDLYLRIFDDQITGESATSPSSTPPPPGVY